MNAPAEEAPRFRFAWALRETLHQGYRRFDALRDIQAGVVTALVALPLAMALAIASGVPPQYGLVTVVVAGAVAAFCGGSRTLVTGPTAAFVALLLPVTLKFGLAGLVTAGFLSGFLLVGMGLLGLGRAVEYVPAPVVTGFTSGVALVIASLQIKDFLGLSVAGAQEHFIDRLGDLARALPTLNPLELSVGLATLGLIIIFGQLIRRVPAPIVALALVTAGVGFLHHLRPDLAVATIGSRFQYQDAGGLHPGIPVGLPGFAWPWQWTAPGLPEFHLGLGTLRAILPSALAIALLGATESLLSAAVADGMTRFRHDPDSELVGQGLANMVAPFFGGIPATGAIARTAAAIRFGARSPFAAATHSLVVLLILLAAAPLAALLPMASLAALLLVVAWNMSETKHFAATLRVGRWGDRLVLLTCFLLTVVFDMTIGVTAGIILASLFLIRRLGELGEARLLEPGDASLPAVPGLDAGTRVFRVSGTLLFGAAGKTLLPLAHYDLGFRTLVLDLSPVRSMDISGLAALEDVVRELRHGGTRVLVAASSVSALELLTRSHYFNDALSGPPVYGSLEAALWVAAGQEPHPPRARIPRGKAPLGRKRPMSRPGARVATAPTRRHRRPPKGD